MDDGDVRDGLGCPSCRTSPGASRRMTDKSPTTARLPDPVDTSFHQEEGKKSDVWKRSESGTNGSEDACGDGTEAGTGRRRGHP